MTDTLTPRPEDKFTFGLWTVGNPGRDPFGEPVRLRPSSVDIVHLLAEVGAMGVNLHDNDLVPIDATPSERDAIASALRRRHPAGDGRSLLNEADAKALLRAYGIGTPRELVATGLDEALRRAPEIGYPLVGIG